MNINAAVFNPSNTEPHPVPDFSEIRIENTNLCGFNCFICPRDRLTREKGIMTTQDLELVLQRVGSFNGRVDLHGYGEPLLDPTLVEKIALVSSTWPGAVTRIFSTLGVQVKPGFWETLPAAGLDQIEISLYGWDRESYITFHGVDRFDLAMQNLAYLSHVSHARAEKNFNTKLVLRRFPVHPKMTQLFLHNHKEKIDSFYRAIQGMGVTLAPDRLLHNYGDGRSYNPPGHQACSIVWGYRKRILQVTWDLRVIPCCFDFDASIPWGNLGTQTLAEIFTGASYRLFVEDHIKNQLRRFPVCLNCERCQME